MTSGIALWALALLLTFAPISDSGNVARHHSRIGSIATRATLTVTLRDLAGIGIAKATITIRDERGLVDLASAITDARGVALLPDLDAAIIRVGVAGMLADHTPLRQRGLDAHGIWFALDGMQNQLDLRVEPDGAVIPDPAMITPDLVVPSRDPQAATAVVQGVPTAQPFGLLAPPSPRPIGQLRAVVVVSLLAMLLALVWFLFRRRAA
jgi:hypothetical protein